MILRRLDIYTRRSPVRLGAGLSRIDDRITPPLTMSDSNAVGMSSHSYDTCTKIIDFLMQRLKKKNHNVKLKTLLVIKVLASV